MPREVKHVCSLNSLGIRGTSAAAGMTLQRWRSSLQAAAPLAWGRRAPQRRRRVARWGAPPAQRSPRLDPEGEREKGIEEEGSE